MESNKSNINIKINIRGANNINILEILLASVLAVISTCISSTSNGGSNNRIKYCFW